MGVHERFNGVSGPGEISPVTRPGWRSFFLKAGDAAAPGRDNVQRLRRILAIALSANAMAGVLIVLDVASDDQDLLLELLTAFDLVIIAVAVRLGFGLLRRESAKNSLRADELAAMSQAKQAAENASRAKSRYLATVSHEIRSPLNAIYGYAQLAERDDGVSPQEAAGVIRRSAEHLTSLVEGLLDIAQLEFGMLRVRNEVIRFGGFIEQIVLMMKPAATAKGLEFNFIAPARMPDHVRLDQSRFRQVLINLLSNAIAYTESGSVTLRVGYSGQIATFEVSDTGPGIAPEDRERIFEPFERGVDVDGPESHNRPGAGLGLAIAKAIVHILGGALELESEVGVGTTFRISMMLNEVTGRGVPQAAPRRVSGYEGRQRHILLVEDDPDQRAFIDRLLGSLGFAVVAVSSGEAALAVDTKVDVDLAILDISLPGISGWQVAEKLRERGGDDLMVLMLSANSEEFHRPEFANPVHDLFLVKPIEFDSLVEAIGGLLNLGWRRDLTADADPAGAAPQVQEGETVGADGRAHIHQLQEYLRIGYVRGVEAEIAKLAEAAPEAGPLVDRLHGYLDRYDLAGMAEFLHARFSQQTQ